MLADAIESDDELRQLVNTVNFRTILISRLHDTAANVPISHIANGSPCPTCT